MNSNQIVFSYYSLISNISKIQSVKNYDDLYKANYAELILAKP